MKNKLSLTQEEISGLVAKARSFNNRKKLKKWLKSLKKNIRLIGLSPTEIDKIEYYAARWDR